MTTVVRRIVSGQKARFKDPILSLDLDLVYVTDNIIIMGFPASGVASLYRNSRSSVRKFLDHRHDDLYRIYNFCPKAENSYDADFFYDRVSRYPFPDHHVPPLSMIPLFVADMTEWLESDPDNVAVIHCKAGKGRSGTMTCCYMLSLPYLPSAPRDLRNYSNLRRPASPPAVADAAEGEAHGRYWENLHHHHREPTVGSDVSSPPPMQGAAVQDAQAEELAAKLQAVFSLHTSRRMKPQPNQAAQASSQTLGRASASFLRSSASIANPSLADLSDGRRAGTPKKGMLGASPAGRSCDAVNLAMLEPPSNGYESRASLSTQRLGHSQSLGRSRSSFALNQNTEDHSTSKEPKMGVSIPSQRRWAGYWARMLAGQDARLAIAQPYLTPPRRKVRITRITIYRSLKTDVKTSSGLATKIVPHAESLSIQLGRYPDTMVDRLEKWERSARRRNRAFGPHDPSLHACDLDIETQKQKEYLKSLRYNSQNLKRWNGERYERLKDGADAVGKWGVNVNGEADRARNFEWNDAPGESEDGLVYFSLVPERDRTLIDFVGLSDDESVHGQEFSAAKEQMWRYSFIPQGQDSKGRKQSQASCDSGYMSSQSAEPDSAATTRGSSGERRSMATASPDGDRQPTNYLDAKQSGGLSPSKVPSLLRRASSSLMRTVGRSNLRRDSRDGLAPVPLPVPAPALGLGLGATEKSGERVTTSPSSNGYEPPDTFAGHGVGQILDADREVMVKILVGRTGNKHAKLPDFTAVGWVWLIPSFEDPASSHKGGRPKVGSRTVVRFDKDEIDFRKHPIDVVGVEVEWEWIDVGDQDDDDDDDDHDGQRGDDADEAVEVMQNERPADRLRTMFDGASR